MVYFHFENNAWLGQYKKQLLVTEQSVQSNIKYNDLPSTKSHIMYNILYTEEYWSVTRTLNVNAEQQCRIINVKYSLTNLYNDIEVISWLALHNDFLSTWKLHWLQRVSDSQSFPLIKWFWNEEASWRFCWHLNTQNTEVKAFSAKLNRSKITSMPRIGNKYASTNSLKRRPDRSVAQHIYIKIV